ncbi:MAG: hypothetical protein JNK53_07235 [Phycisphaerae bacterium]|nr:hypothetical protein [Phycisphaerae bacterium]
MPGWDQTKEWAAANPDMAKALLAAQSAFVFGMPYGRANVPPEFVEKGLFIAVGEGENMFVTTPAYMNGMGVVAAYVAAEMYRLGEEKKFEEAFALGLASMRVWRQMADQQLLEEKRLALEGLCDLASLQRDFMQTYLKEIAPVTLKRMALDGYPFVRAADAERLRRLEMPEGDRVVAEIALADMFDAQGQADRTKFAAVMAPLQARKEPLSQFGAARRWESIAEVHGSLDATKAKMTSVYDDWWRRWRVRYFDPLLDNPTALSRTNKVRYAMVMLVARDLESIFALRKRTNAELNGTALAAGLCAWNRELSSWPRSMDQSYTQYVRKRFDYDPFDPDYGRWKYESLSSPKVVDCEFGRVEVSDCLLYAVGLDRVDAGGLKATKDGLTGDFIAWPALRALSRAQHTQP